MNIGGSKSIIFTYEMIVRRLENELGINESREYTLVEQDSEGYTIRVSFVKNPKLAEGLYYVTTDLLDVIFE